MQNVLSQNGQPRRDGPFAYDSYAGLIACGVQSVLTCAAAAASRYVDGNLSPGEHLHAQAELTYTRLLMHLSCFGQQADTAADEQLSRVQVRSTSFGYCTEQRLKPIYRTSLEQTLVLPLRPTAPARGIHDDGTCWRGPT